MLGFSTVESRGPLPVSGGCLGPGWTWCGSEHGPGLMGSFCWPVLGLGPYSLLAETQRRSQE